MRKIARSIIIHDDKLLVIKRNKRGDKYYTLPGGGIDEDETPEQAAVREVLEEASIESRVVRRIYQDEPTEFGSTAYFLSEYISGSPRLAEDSVEAITMKKEDNTWEPIWLHINELLEVRLLPEAIHSQLVHDLKSGFSEGILTIKVEAEKL